MIRLQNKKASHVGMILSFVIFVTFLIFLFSILGSPIKLPSNKDALIDYLEIELAERFAANLTILTISPINSGSEPCIAINIDTYGLTNLNTLVKDKNNALVGSRESGDYLFVDWPTDEEFFKIFYSEETLNNLDFTSTGTCHGLQIAEVNSVRENSYYNSDKIKQFILDYETNYLSFKTELNVPQNSEFGLGFVNSSDGLIETPQRDIITDIFSREIPIQYFDESANIKSGFINIRVW